MNRRQAESKARYLMPVLGVVLFGVLYVAATRYYPGGSQEHTNSSGFSWVHNYWCNLLNEKAINGQLNGGMPIARTGMAILGWSLSLFWLLFSGYAGLTKTFGRVVWLSGSFSMLLGFFIFTSAHDWLVNAAGLLGAIAVVGTFVGLRKLRWQTWIYWGYGILILVVVNNVCYHSAALIYYLPVVQKVTFVYVLFWICAISWKMFRDEPGANV